MLPGPSPVVVTVLVATTGTSVRIQTANPMHPTGVLTVQASHTLAITEKRQ